MKGSQLLNSLSQMPGADLHQCLGKKAQKNLKKKKSLNLLVVLSPVSLVRTNSKAANSNSDNKSEM